METQYFDEKLTFFIEKINKEENAVILVEGKKDKRALEILGVKIPIIYIKGTPLLSVLEELSEYFDKIIIMFDMDKKGEKLTRECIQIANSLGLDVDVKYRLYLCKKFRIVQLESSRNFLYNHRVRKKNSINRIRSVD